MTYKTYHDLTTRSSVLRAAANVEDKAAWGRFFDLYAGFVFAIARSKGLSADDADDVVQSVFTDLSRKLPTFEYDRTKGRFRSYLLELVNWRVIDKLKSGKREAELMTAYSQETNVLQTPENSASAVDLEWQSQALNEALRRLKNEVKEEHFTAFVESAIEGVDTETVMKLHGISRDNLYQIRTRLTTKLRPLINAVLKEMDEGMLPRGNGDAD